MSDYIVLSCDILVSSFGIYVEHLLGFAGLDPEVRPLQIVRLKMIWTVERAVRHIIASCVWGLTEGVSSVFGFDAGMVCWTEGS